MFGLAADVTGKPKLSSWRTSSLRRWGNISNKAGRSTLLRIIPLSTIVSVLIIREQMRALWMASVDHISLSIALVCDPMARILTCSGYGLPRSRCFLKKSTSSAPCSPVPTEIYDQSEAAEWMILKRSLQTLARKVGRSRWEEISTTISAGRPKKFGEGVEEAIFG